MINGNAKYKKYSYVEFDILAKLFQLTGRQFASNRLDETDVSLKLLNVSNAVYPNFNV